MAREREMKMVFFFFVQRKILSARIQSVGISSKQIKFSMFSFCFYFKPTVKIENIRMKPMVNF